MMRVEWTPDQRHFCPAQKHPLGALDPLDPLVQAWPQPILSITIRFVPIRKQVLMLLMGCRKGWSAALDVSH